MLNLWPLKIHTESRTGNENGRNELVLLALCAVALIAPFFLTPSPTLAGTHTQLCLPPCFFKLITHLPCPFCGATTSFTLIAHGDFHRALLANPWGPIMFVYLLIITASLILALIRKRSLRIEVRLKLTSGLFLFGTIWTVNLLVWFSRSLLI